MKDRDKSKQDLIEELLTLRQKVTALEKQQDEFGKTEERLARLGEALMSMGPDAFDNMNRLVDVCRKLMGATCVQYNSLKHGILYSLDQSSAADYGSVLRPEGNSLHDMIKEAGEDTIVIRNLQESQWGRTEPMVTIHNLQTCIGQAVRFRDDFLGSLCVAFQEDFDPTSMDKSLVRAIAVAIGAGERRLRVQTALRKSEEKYRAVFENATVGMSLKDSKGRFLEANSTLLRMLGHTKDELASLTYLDVTHPDDIPASRKMHAALVKGEVGSYRIRKRYVRTDRSVLWGDASVTAIRDARGKHLLTVGALVDISEQKLTEETALREQNLSNMTIDALGGVFYLLDYQLAFLRWNKNFETVSGYSGKEIATKRALDFFEGTDRQIVEEAIREIWTQGEGSREADLTTKDG
jgi:PAS domain S-box-containing protein